MRPSILKIYSPPKARLSGLGQTPYA